MEHANQQLLDFLNENPGATKANISEALKLKGLPLFNLLRKFVNEGEIVEEGEGPDATYFIVKVNAEASGTDDVNEENLDSDDQEQSNLSEDEDSTSATDESSTLKQQTAEPTGETDSSAENKTEPVTTGRDSSKYTFNGEQLGKGPLVRAVIAQYVKDHQDITYEELKAVFPDTLLKRFGIFQDVDTAKIIAKGGRRYFTKPEQTIKLKDKTIVVTNQFTLANIQPFLNVANEFGFEIG